MTKRKTKKRKRRGTKRILGNERGLMFICKDIRRRWLQYGENRLDLEYNCFQCGVDDTLGKLQIDHIKPLGSRPRTWNELGDYAKRMFENKCQALCKKCHKAKTDAERKRRKSK